MLPSQNKWIIASVGSLCKLFFASKYASFQLRESCNSQALLQYILEPASRQGRPLITFSNHISTIDDPVMWSFLPVKTLFSNPQQVRWTLGADEILFQSNPKLRFSTPIHALFWRLSSAFFHAGKVLPIIRGNGLHQPGILLAEQVLKEGDWLHIFVEGKVYPLSRDILLPVKWGTAHLILDYYENYKVSPIIFPLMLQGSLLHSENLQLYSIYF